MGAAIGSMVLTPLFKRRSSSSVIPIVGILRNSRGHPHMRLLLGRSSWELPGRLESFPGKRTAPLFFFSMGSSPPAPLLLGGQRFPYRPHRLLVYPPYDSEFSLVVV